MYALLNVTGRESIEATAYTLGGAPQSASARIGDGAFVLHGDDVAALRDFAAALLAACDEPSALELAPEAAR